MKSSVRKMLLTALTVILALVLGLFSVSCKDEVETYTLTFVTGEGVAVIEPITGEAGVELTPPTAPVKEGYVFVGWYDNAGFEGSAVELPATMPAENKTYYARFNELQTGKLTLNVGEGGTLATTEYELEVGANISEFMAELVPTAKGDAKFDGWYVGNTNKLLGSAVTMPAAGYALTAKYDVAYTVNVYLQNETDDSFTLSETLSVSGTDRVGEELEFDDLSIDVENWFAVDTAQTTESVTLGAVAADNVMNVYYKWKLVTVQFQHNAPAFVDQNGNAVDVEVNGEVASLTVRAGASYALPENGFSIDGFRFAGWTTNKTSTKYLSAGDEMKASTRPMEIIFAQWNQAAKDQNGGSDRVYDLKEAPGTVVLERQGLGEEKFGSYDLDTRLFTFEVNGSTTLTGKIFEGGESFAYYSSAFDKTFTVENWKDGTVEAGSDTLTLDGIAGGVYNDGSVDLEGAFQYDFAEGAFVFSPADETKAFYFTLDHANGSFRMRDEATAVVGYYADEMNTILDYPYLVLNGFGVAEYYEGADKEPLTTTYHVVGTYSEKFGATEVQHSVVQLVPDEGGVLPAQYYIRYVSTSGYLIPVVFEFDNAIVTVTVQTEKGDMTFTTDGFENANYTRGEEKGSFIYTTEGSFNDGDKTWNYLSFRLDGSTYTVAYDEAEPSVAKRVGNEVGVYTQTYAETGYYTRMQLVSEDTSGAGTAYFEVSKDGDGYERAGSVAYTVQSEDGLDTFAQFGSFDALSGYGELAAAYTDKQFRANGGDYTFALKDGLEKTYLFKVGEYEYKLSTKGYGAATFIGDGESEDVIYYLTKGYTFKDKTYDFVVFLYYGAMYVLKAEVKAEANISAEFLNIRFPTGIYYDYSERLEGDQVIELYYDGHMRVLEKEGDEYTKVVAEGTATAVLNSAQSDIEYCEFKDETDASGLYKEFKFYYTGKNDWRFFGVYEKKDIDISNDKVVLDGYGLATAFENQYRYELDGEYVYFYETWTDATEHSVKFQLVDGKIVNDIAFGNFYNLITEADGSMYIGDYAITLNGETEVELTDLETLEIVATGTYARSELVSDAYVLTFTGEYAAQSGLITLHTVYGDNEPYAVYSYGDANKVASYVFEDGATLTSDAFFTVKYVDANKGDEYLVYLYDVDTSVLPGSTVVSLIILDAAENLSRYGIYMVVEENGRSVLKEMPLGYGEYYLYDGESADKTSKLVLDGVSTATLGGKTGSYVAGTRAQEYIVTWSDGSTLSVMLKAIVEDEKEVLVYVVQDGAWDKTFVSATWETLIVDGYGNALYIDFNGVAYEVSYEVVSDTELRLYGDIFDQLTGEAFTDKHVVVSGASFSHK